MEIITPDEMFEAQVLEIKDEDGLEQEIGNTNDEIYLNLSRKPENYKYAIGRTVGIKNQR